MSQNQVGFVQVSPYSPEEIKEISCVEVKEKEGLDPFHVPIPNGLYDEKMGPCRETSLCETCNLGMKECPGHFGHHQLCFPVLHSFTKKYLLHILNMSCPFCKRLAFESNISFLFMKLYDLLDYNCVKYADQLERIHFFDFKNAKKWDFKRKSLSKKVKKIIQKKVRKEGFDKDLKKYCEHLSKSSVFQIHVFEKKKDLFNLLLKEVGKLDFCCHCHMPLATFSVQESNRIMMRGIPKKYSKRARTLYEENGKEKPFFNELTKQLKGEISSKTSTFEIHPKRVYDYFVEIEKEEQKMLSYMFQPTQAERMKKKLNLHDLFFVRILPISANRFRMPNRVNGEEFMDACTKVISSLIQHNNEIKEKVLLYEKERIARERKEMSDEEEDGENEEEDDENDDAIFNAFLKRKMTSKEDIEFLKQQPLLIRSSRIQNDINLIYGSQAQGLYQKSSFNGVKGILDKKEGLFRQNMMGKRVNFSARSVILPDPCILPSEVAVPLFYAKKMTYPERVTFQNLAFLQERVVNGPFQYPGANSVVDSRGFTIDLQKKTRQERESLANRLWKDRFVAVLRHLKDGDLCLMNRQPTLHRPSILCHRIRVIPTTHKSLRFHYPNCNSYNADFDGDEMNFHVPQSELARAEAEELLQNAGQYCSPTSGDPLRGLIQDDICSGVLLTKKDSFLTPEHFVQLVYSSLFFLPSSFNLDLPTPAVLCPKPLFTGKQVVTAILKNLVKFFYFDVRKDADGFYDDGEKKKGMNLKDAACKIKGDAFWGKGSEEEDYVNILDNEFLTGVLDKNHLGARNYGLVHCFYMLFGAKLADYLLSSFSRCFMEFLHVYGVSCRFDDFLLHKKTMSKRKKDLQHMNERGCPKAVKGSLRGKDMKTVLNDERDFKKLEFAAKKFINTKTSKIQNQTASGMRLGFPYNFIVLMTSSGAKGSSVNVNQICCCLGQQYFEGKRVQMEKMTGQTLPCFSPFSSDAHSGGFVTSRFFDGIHPYEFFYHCQAGRDGLIDTAVKTAKSGYLQRSLIKALEISHVAYDGTVRTPFGGIVQFEYGADGVDVTKRGTLNPKNFDFLVSNYDLMNESFKRMGYDDPNDFPDKRSEVFRNDVKEYIKKNKEKLEKQEIHKKDFKNFMKYLFSSSSAEGGDPVGLLAAQGVGEPSTQMTLNTFHFAGLEEEHVTQGIPRLRSILMSGTEKNPIFKVPLNETIKRRELELVEFMLSNITLDEIIRKIKIRRTLTKPENEEDTMFNLHINIFYDVNKVKNELKFSKETIVSFFHHFLHQLNDVIDGKELTRAVSGKSKELMNKGLEEALDQFTNFDDRSDEKQNRRKGKKKSRKMSDDGDEEEEEEQENNEKDDDDDGDEEEEEEEEEEKKIKMEDEEKEENEENEENEEQIERSEELEVNIEKGKVKIQLEIPLFDLQTDLISMIKSVAKSIQLRNMEDIRSFNFTQDKEKKRQLVVEVSRERSNDIPPTFYRSIYQLKDHLNVEEAYTNDIKSFTREFGVEAGRQLCENELIQVFHDNGVTVDFRHVNLISDSMFFRGEYFPCNRFSKKNLPGVLGRSTFEMSTSYLMDGVVFNETDPLKDVSSQLCVGKLTTGGTGSFDVRFDLSQKMKEQQV